MSDFTMTEIRALAQAFDGLKWDRHSDEPDARVTVLFYEGERTDSPYLCRVDSGWAWAKDVEEIRQPNPDTTNWKFAVGWVPSSEPLRLPVAEELLKGGWAVDWDAPEGPQPEPVDEAKVRLDEGLNALEATVVPAARTEQYLKAQTHFLASIAVSLYELTALHKAYAPEPEKLELVHDVTDTVAEVKKTIGDATEKVVGQVSKESELRGPIGGDSFPWAR